jgi:hypothetical protein
MDPETPQDSTPAVSWSRTSSGPYAQGTDHSSKLARRVGAGNQSCTSRNWWEAKSAWPPTLPPNAHDPWRSGTGTRHWPINCSYECPSLVDEILLAATPCTSRIGWHFCFAANLSVIKACSWGSHQQVSSTSRVTKPAINLIQKTHSDKILLDGISILWIARNTS